MQTYFSRHLQVLIATLGSMVRAPLSSITTIIIIGITLVLPMILFITLKSGQQLSQNWQGRPQISIFIEQDISHQEAKLIFEEIRLHPAIELAEYLSPEQAIEEFRTLSGMSDELDFIGENPLPPSIVVMPDNAYAKSDSLLALKEELSKIEGIEIIRLDLDWTDKFNAILKVFARVALLLSVLLSIALILIVSNTIKLLIFNRRHEIEITKLVGGSNSFVRRPFLYYGLLFGIFGALLALVLLLSSSYWVAPTLEELAILYQRQSLIYALKLDEIFSVVGIGALIGWLAARWSVAHHLRQIKPR